MLAVTDLMHIYRIPKDEIDSYSKEVQQEIVKHFKIDTGRVKHVNIFEIDYVKSNKLNSENIIDFSYKVLRDPIQHDLTFDTKQLNKFHYSSFILTGKHSGVTDDEATIIKQVLKGFLNLDSLDTTLHVRTKELYLFEKFLDEDSLSKIATTLSNPLIHYSYFVGDLTELIAKKAKFTSVKPATKFIDLNQQVSDERHLGFDDLEIKAILNIYANKDLQKIRASKGLPDKPSDCELELLAQTWSEHCKHKEFNAVINYHDSETGKNKVIYSLFNTYIKGATNEIKKQLEAKGHDWLVKVFNDNAGIVKIDADNYFVWKVETHNSPSLLDPYGGAITGILGNNRDALGTGIGGAKLLFNTNVLCFGPPNYNKPLLKGQKHPKQILSGVVKGIMDGGNKSGIPTVNGSIHFDERYSGKPLVFCGTGAVMPAKIGDRKTEDKVIESGDYIVMAGGLVGKDGIHGATLSSTHIDNNTPGSMVQIGSPLTQKKLSDFLEDACLKGLVKTCTDNGAGGLGSSVGEMACISGGAIIELDKVPLKYPGLNPWEILISESQERMTLVIEPDIFEELSVLANSYHVDISLLGEFNNTGWLEVLYKKKHIAALPLEFLHNGVPVKKIDAIWKSPINQNFNSAQLPEIKDYNSIILDLLSSYNICSRENIIRQYDHEVKANTIVKPLMGVTGCAPQDAAVVRLNYDSYQALIISNGILPRIGDVDAYNMSAGSFDEAVRQIIAVGGELPDLSKKNSKFWSVNDNFCLPNCIYDKDSNQDGHYKAAQLVRMCQALYDYATFFLIPMTSGKDSMKNDFIDHEKKQKISIPPTVLYSCVSQIDDFRMITTAHFKQPTDLIYLLGETYDEMATSELYHLLKIPSNKAPIVRKEAAKDCYQLVTKARKLGLLSSCHDISDGGLAIALIESTFGGLFGMEINLPLDSLASPLVWLFSESPSRFVVSIKAENQITFENLAGNKAKYLGKVTAEKKIRISADNKLLVNLTTEECLQAWKNYDL